MSDPDRRTEARRWLRYAREDLEAAEAMLGQARIQSRHVCWLAQQAAEKAIKAGLVSLQVEFPRSHDLDALRNLMPEDWMARSQHPDLAELTEWAVEARYPGDWPEATQTDAAQAVEQARAVCEAVRRDLTRRGLSRDDAG